MDCVFIDLYRISLKLMSTGSTGVYQTIDGVHADKHWDLRGTYYNIVDVLCISVLDFTFGESCSITQEVMS